MILPLFSLLWSCTDATVIGTDKINNSEEEILIWTLSVDISSEGVVGSELPYTVSLIEEQGMIAEDISWRVSSDIEDLQYTQEYMIASVATIHNLTFTTEYEGVEYSAEAIVDLSASEIDQIDLVLSAHVITAGEELSYSIVAYDAFGNEVDTSAIERNIEGPNYNDSSMGSEKITSTTPGLYTVAASFGDIQDVELLQVIPGPTVSLTLEVPSGDVELNETIACKITTLDEFGNETEDPWTLSTIGGTTDILYNNIIFWEEDFYEIRAQLDSDPSIFDTYGPFMVDSTGPLLTVVSPERAEWNTSHTGTVSGNVYDYPAGLDELVVDGNVISPDSSGNFSLPTEYIYGINIIETTALDLDGNDSTDIRAVLSGEFQPKFMRFNDAIAVFLGNNNDGLGALETYAEGYIDNMDLSSMIPTGNIVDQSQCVIDTWFGCALRYTIRLRLNGASYGSSNLELSTNSNGTIQANATVYNISIGWIASGTVDASGTVTASSATVNMVLTPSVTNNQLHINLNSVSSSFGNLNFNMSGLLGDIIDFFGIDSYIEGQMESYAEDAIRDVVSDEIPPILEAILSEFSIHEQFVVMGTTYTLTSVPSDVHVDNNGLTLYMTSNLTGNNWIQPTNGLGSLMSSISAPQWPSGTGVGINLSLNIVNQLLYQAWGGGILNMELSTASLGLNSDDLAIVFPNATDLRVTVDALLPPVVVEDNTGALEMQAGDIYIAIHNGDLADNDVRLELYAHFTAPMDIDVANNAITPSIGDPVFTFNVVYPNSGSASANSTESLLSTLLPYVMPSLENAIAGIEIPQLGDFTFQNMSSNIADNHVNASAALQAN